MQPLGQNLGEISSNIVKKRNRYFNGIFSYFAWGIATFTSKKVVVIEMPEWKLKTKLARNTIFEGNYDKLFACFVSKIAKSDYFRGLYFSWLVFIYKSHTCNNFYLFEGLKIKILLKEFHIVACLGPKYGPMLGQKCQKRPFP